MTAAYTMTLGGNSLPLPAAEGGIGLEYMPLGSVGRSASGRLSVDHVTSKWRARLRWEGLSKAERDSLWGYFGTYVATAATLILPDGESIEVMTALGSWTETASYSPWDADLTVYEIQFTVEET